MQYSEIRVSLTIAQEADYLINLETVNEICKINKIVKQRIDELFLKKIKEETKEIKQNTIIKIE